MNKPCFFTTIMIKENVKTTIETYATEIVSLPINLVEVTTQVAAGVILIACRYYKRGVRDIIHTSVEGADKGLDRIGSLLRTKKVTKEEKPLWGSEGNLTSPPVEEEVAPVAV